MSINTIKAGLTRYGTTLRVGAILIFGLAIGLAWSALPSHSASADGEKKIINVKGTATLQFFSGEACAPHPGTCLKGTLTGDLSGEAFIRIFTREVVPGSERTVSVATAAISITRPDGRLDGAAAGFSDTGTGDFRNVTPWVGGTGAYESATGHVEFKGVTDFATGAANETYEGVLILDKE